MGGFDDAGFDAADVVRRYLAGERDAADELMRHFRPYVMSIISRGMGNDLSSDWEDCFQVIWLKAFLNLRNLSKKGKFRAWIGTISRRVVIDWRNSLSRDTLLDAEFASPAPPISQDTIDCIEQTAAKFPPKLAEYLRMKIEGASNKEIAQRTGKSISTIHNWRRIVRELLQHCLEP